MYVMYTGVLSTFQNAGVYGKDKIHMAPFPEFDEKVTNIATWQYVLNKNSDHKEAALKSFSMCPDMRPAKITDS